MTEYLEHRIDCGENTVAICHPAEFTAALFRGQHINYDLEPLKVGEPAVTNFAWIRCLRSVSAAWDLVAGGWQQHFTAHRGDTLFLPLTVCQWLLANRPTDWQQMTVVPGTLDAGLSNDVGTGLNYLPAVSTGAWGRDSMGSYFTLDGDMGEDERAIMTVDDSGAVFMDQ